MGEGAGKVKKTKKKTNYPKWLRFKVVKIEKIPRKLVEQYESEFNKMLLNCANATIREVKFGKAKK